MTDGAEPIIRSYRDGDEQQINELFNRIFGTHRTLEEWVWKYKANPVADSRVICLAEANGRIIGQYACIPRRLKFKEGVIKGTFVADNFVVPEHRGGVRGIQWKTFNHGCEIHRADSYACGLGFPNREHYIVGKRFMGYRDFGNIDVLRRRLNWHASIRRRMPWLPAPFVNAAGFLASLGTRRRIAGEGREDGSRAQVRPVDAFDERFDAFWERVRDQHGIIGVRNRQYLSWRYGRPGMKYEILISEIDGEMSGYLVSTIADEERGRTGHIVDLLVDERKDAGDSLITNALVRFLSAKADHATCWMMGHCALHGTLEQHGFERDEGQPVHGVYMIFGRGIDEAFIGDARNWYVTMGDSDVF